MVRSSCCYVVGLCFVASQVFCRFLASDRTQEAVAHIEQDLLAALRCADSGSYPLLGACEPGELLGFYQEVADLFLGEVVGWGEVESVGVGWYH